MPWCVKYTNFIITVQLLLGIHFDVLKHLEKVICIVMYTIVIKANGASSFYQLLLGIEIFAVERCHFDCQIVALKSILDSFEIKIVVAVNMLDYVVYVKYHITYVLVIYSFVR